MKYWAAIGFAIATLAWCPRVCADEQHVVTVVNVPAPQPAQWGLYTGRTLGTGGGAIIFDAGWPGFIVSALFGLTKGFDLGVRIAANYTGVTNYAANGLSPEYGMDIRLTTRFSLYESNDFAMLLSIEPGWHIPEFIPAFTSGPSLIASVGAGIRVIDSGALYLGLDVPFYLQVTPGRVITFVSILPGVGFEYHLLPLVAIGARVNAGPLLYDPAPITGSLAVDFDLVAQAYVFFRWRGAN